LDKGVLLDLY
jgi:hypothetical protein